MMDPYLKQSFSSKNKMRRFIWSTTWKFMCRFSPVPFHRWRILILRLFGARIGKQNHIYPTCKIWAPWLLETSNLVTIGPGVEIYNPAGVRLGHHSVLSQDSYLCGATHNYNSLDFPYVKKQITIDPYVWICAKAVVLPGVHCKEGSVLGAISITSKDLELWTIYAGNPAREIKKRTNFLKEAEESNL